MSRSRKKKDQPWRRVRVRGIRRAAPDIAKLGAAVIALAQAQADKEAQQEHERRMAQERNNSPGDAA